ncbi:hypothetical protein NDU88_005603 [Pleurodeles waltl]|uniref:Uncharacterized protein n=1 Tax=Pleurodeles waltl TaxID=8319 RepID=A0AAV7M9U4_PLEWA|nr:hypothetical protein NDU88_005603 [Pleurodeles waltl]
MAGLLLGRWVLGSRGKAGRRSGVRPRPEEEEADREKGAIPGARWVVVVGEEGETLCPLATPCRRPTSALPGRAVLS